MSVAVEPQATEVRVNGISYGRGKLRFSLPVGEWQVDLSAPGFASQSIALRVEPGVSYTIRRRLVREMAQPPREPGHLGDQGSDARR